MKISKNVLAAGLVTVATGTLLGVSSVTAQSSDTSAETIVDKIVSTFNLDREEVEAVFEEHREQKHEERQAHWEERLADLVEEGSLTQDQANRLHELHTEHHEKIEALREQGADRDEIHDQIQQHRDDMKSWAEEEGIELDGLQMFNGPRGFGRHGGGMMNKES